jgi:hypothetical protein
MYQEFWFGGSVKTTVDYKRNRVTTVVTDYLNNEEQVTNVWDFVDDKSLLDALNKASKCIDVNAYWRTKEILFKELDISSDEIKYEDDGTIRIKPSNDTSFYLEYSEQFLKKINDKLSEEDSCLVKEYYMDFRMPQPKRLYFSIVSEGTVIGKIYLYKTQ